MTLSSVEQFHDRVDAVLSQNFIQHGKNIRQIDPTALHQTGNQLDVTNRCSVNPKSYILVDFFIGARSRETVLSTAGGIQMLFLFLAFWALVIFGASAYSVLAPMSIPAAERAAKIIAAGIPRMGEKQDLAMPAPRQAFS